jgi:hypothetical protein
MGSAGNRGPNSFPGERSNSARCCPVGDQTGQLRQPVLTEELLVEINNDIRDIYISRLIDADNGFLSAGRADAHEEHVNKLLV